MKSLSKKNYYTQCSVLGVVLLGSDLTKV